jgi:hypothetical protein
MSKTYYDILGVSSQATQNIIRTAFRQKAQIVHPDKIQAQIAHLDPYAADRLKLALEEDFRELKEAYDVLSDHQKRKEYDDLLRQIRINSPPPTSPPPSARTSAPPTSSVSFCTVCGSPLTGNRCLVCASQGFRAIKTGANAFLWVAITILAVVAAVTIPKDDAWDPGTCFALLFVGVLVFVAGIKKGLWGGVRNLYRMRPKIAIFAAEVISLVVLALGTGALNPPPKANVTLSKIPNAKSATNSGTSPVLREAVAPLTFTSKQPTAPPLTGEFKGVVRNQSAGLSADFEIAVKESNGILSGCMAVQRPLYGSGPWRVSCMDRTYPFPCRVPLGGSPLRARTKVKRCGVNIPSSIRLERRTRMERSSCIEASLLRLPKFLMERAWNPRTLGECRWLILAKHLWSPRATRRSPKQFRYERQCLISTNRAPNPARRVAPRPRLKDLYRD